MNEIKIFDIKSGRRSRIDLGDLVALADNNNEIGLFHPLVIKPDRNP